MYPSIYWNCGCLIVNSGDQEGSTTDYSKIAVALGNTIKHGIDVNLVDINTSESEFTPNQRENAIYYGFRSLSGIGYDFIQTIIENRPFSSMEDFVERANPDKSQMVSLIKAGAFMNIDDKDRKITLLKYAKLITTKRKNLTIAQIPLLVEAGILDVEKFETEYRVYEFNRYIKEALLKTERKEAILDERSIAFLDSIGKESFYEYKDFSRGSDYILDTKQWSSYYKVALNPIRDWFKQNKQEILSSVRIYEMVDIFNQNGEGTVSKWEMQSMSFYHSGHELDVVDYDMYNIVPFSTLNRSPQKVASGRWFRNQTSSIIGTVIGKDSTKGSVNLLTREGDVVLLKMYKGAFSNWNRQISERQDDGSKKVVDKSWFTRGNKLFVHGYRRDDQFVPKSYANSGYPELALITGEFEDGTITLRTERASGD